MKKISVCADDRGFTLVELIVAIVILAIVFVPLLSAFVTGARTQAKSSQKNAATLAAQNIIEQIQADSIEAFRSKLSGDTIPYSCSYSDASATGYTATVTATPVQQLSNDAKTPVNSQKVAVSNRMDAWVDMSKTDDDALNAFSALANGQASDAALRAALRRTVKITSTKAENFYDVSITFSYYGSVQYPVADLDEDGNITGYHYETATLGQAPGVTTGTPYDIVDSETISVPDNLNSLIAAKKPSFSLYISFKPILQQSKYYYSDDFEIYNNNKDGADFNVFFIDVLDETATSGGQVSNVVNYTPSIVYYNQQDLSCARVFSNIAMRAGLKEYIAHSGDANTPRKSIPVDGTLVEKKAVDRMYNIEVKIYSQNDNTKPVVTMSAIKLG